MKYSGNIWNCTSKPETCKIQGLYINEKKKFEKTLFT